MGIEQVLSYIATLGLGGLIGVLLKSFFDYRVSSRRMLFEARTKAYTGITGRLFNLFQEPDIQSLPDPVKFVKINALLSEIMLMGSHKLVELLGEYKVKVYEFHLALGKKDDEKSDKLHKELVESVGKIYVQMRKDMHVDSKGIFK